MCGDDERGRHARWALRKHGICAHGTDARLDYVRAGSLDESRHERTRCSCLGRNSQVGTARGYLDICLRMRATPRIAYPFPPAAASVVAHLG